MILSFVVQEEMCRDLSEDPVETGAANAGDQGLVRGSLGRAELRNPLSASDCDWARWDIIALRAASPSLAVIAS